MASKIKMTKGSMSPEQSSSKGSATESGSALKMSGPAAGIRLSPRKRVENKSKHGFGISSLLAAARKIGEIDEVQEAEIPQPRVMTFEPARLMSTEMLLTERNKMIEAAMEQEKMMQMEAVEQEKIMQMLETDQVQQVKPVEPVMKPLKTDKKKKTTKALESLETISIDTLKELPGKQLVDLFTQREESNSYSNNIVIACNFFAHKKCGEKFLGYRNPTAANNKAMKHIQEHIEAEMKNGDEFWTNSVTFRRKQDEINKKKAATAAKKQKKSPPKSKGKAAKPESQDVKRSPPRPKSPTSPKSPPKPKAEDKPASPQPNKRKRKKTEDKENQTSEVAAVKDSPPAKRSRLSISSEDSLETDAVLPNTEHPQEEENLDTLWAHILDHSYAATQGASPRQEQPTRSSSSMSRTSVSSGVSGESEPATPTAGPSGLSGHPFASQEETINTAGHVSPQRANSPNFWIKQRPEVEIPQHIKDLCKKYILEIQTKKKDENYPLVCKICNTGKVFTAAASVINHYRSHAGIKLFKCVKCKRQFTRKHSLNYHMLIHKQDYKFDCDYCKKRFRHKSHYREHIRKHTGECPYSCIDCIPAARYKTRNTFKRHLKTHHGKILQKDGTIVICEEELAKVRTKKPRKSNARRGSSDAAQQGQSSASTSASTSPSSTPKREPCEESCTPPPLPPAPQHITLPPVGTILSGFNPGGATQASLGILPPIEPLQAAALTMNTGHRHHTLVYPGLPNSLPTPVLLPATSQATIVCQAGTIMCQALPISQAAGLPHTTQGQTFYTITGFAPVVAVSGHAQNAQILTPQTLTPQTFFSAHQPTFRQTSQPAGAGDPADLIDYKPVGYVTHT